MLIQTVDVKEAKYCLSLAITRNAVLCGSLIERSRNDKLTKINSGIAVK